MSSENISWALNYYSRLEATSWKMFYVCKPIEQEIINNNINNNNINNDNNNNNNNNNDK